MFDSRKLSLLCSVLHEEVYKSLFEAGLAESTSITEVITFLRDTYGRRRLPEDFEREYQTTTRREGEPLTKLAERLQALKRKGGSTTTPRLISVRFIEAIGEVPWAGWLKNFVMCEDISTFRVVVDKAVRLENGQSTFKVSCHDVNAVHSHVKLQDNSTLPAAKQQPQPLRTDEHHCSPLQQMEAVLTKCLQQIITSQTAVLSKILEAVQQPQRAPPTTYAAAAGAPPAASRAPPRQGATQRPRSRCFGCASPNHLVRDCPWSCDYCMRKGHSTEDCRVPRPLNAAGGAHNSQ